MPFPSAFHRSSWTLALLATLACPHAATSETAALEAELPSALSADHLNPDSFFLLKVCSPWDYADCHVAPGALLRATVQHVTRLPNGHVQEIAFALAVPCGDRKPVDVVVTSLLAPPKVETFTEQFPSYGSFGAGAQPQPVAAPLNFNAVGMARGTPQGSTTTTIRTNALPKAVALGEVWRLPHIRLVLPSSGGTTSDIASASNSLRLPENTIFILQIAREARQSTHALPVTAGSLATVRHRGAPPFLNACRTDHCTSYPAAPPPAAFGPQSISFTQDLTRFGLRPEHDHEVSQLGLATTVHFVSDTEVLITFPTHGLVFRTAAERPTDNPQAVRALLFNTGSHTFQQLADWTIDDHNTFVWPLGSRLLVHEGHNLRILGQGAQEIVSLALPLPVASLRVSPDGEHILLGELHELHSVDDHRALTETDPRGPQEEVLWSLLDSKLQRVGTFGLSSSFVPTPALTNHGLIELRKGPDPEWFLVGRNWTGDRSEKQLGTLRSDCLPVLNGLAPDLFAITTCNANGTGTHNFLVRESGLLLIDQAAGSQELPIAFATSGDARRIALLRTQASDLYTRGLMFHLSTLEHQQLEIVSADRGSLFATVPLPQIAPYRDAFALSPTGDTLALISGHHLLVYSLHP